MLGTNPLAVLISDIHFTLNTLDVASKALKHALNTAKELQVPLVIAGDLHDSKAIIRAEIANTIIDILKTRAIPVIILVGNHDLVNEKLKDHGLNYLKPYAYVVEEPTILSLTDIKSIQFIPYQSDSSVIPSLINENKYTDLVVMHQGIKGAYMGEYIQDKTSINPEVFNLKKVYSGHYHRHQTIGSVTYIGNPYTMTFGEAADGPKGYLVLNQDGTHNRILLNDLRRHYVVEYTLDNLQSFVSMPEDLVWLKITGPKSELDKLNKKDLGLSILRRTDYKLELIPTDTIEQTIEVSNKTHSEILDNLIDNLSESDTIKQELKCIWKDLVR